MKSISLTFLALLLAVTVFSQPADTLSLETCIAVASQRSPLNLQKNLTGEVFSNTVKNLNTLWYPSIGIQAQAIYYSETVHFSDLMEGLPVTVDPLPLDQYKIWADVNQQLFDGGVVKARKAAEKASYEASIQQVESELLALKQQVNQTYFSLLAVKVSTAVVEVSLHELQERKKVVKAGVDNGVVLPENMLALEAEELRLQQKLLELRSNREQLVEVLSILMDTTLQADLVIQAPLEAEGFTASVMRPEHVLLDKQKEQLAAHQKLVTAKDLPRFFAFSQVAYGRPGYNFLSREFHPFYAVGMGMQWNFLHYGDSRRQKKILDIQQDILEVKRKTFDDQLNIQLEAEKNNLAKYEALLRQDETILQLRQSIAETSLSKLTHGTITATDYLVDLNAEILARLMLENHKILKIQASYNYLLLQGNL
jgi:outer membrane protein TolC